MSDTDAIFGRFMDEFKATLSQSGQDAILRRINAERLLRLLAEEFAEDLRVERVRVLPDNRLTGEPGADFLVQVDDYDIRLELLDAPDGVPQLDPGQLPHLLRLLEDNPSTVALVLVWTVDDLLAVPISAKRLRFLIQHSDRVGDLLRGAEPLSNVLHTLVAQQTRDWSLGPEGLPPASAQGADMRRLFEAAIGTAIEAERKRSYRYVERKLAARQFPAEEEKRVIFSALHDALNGATAPELVPQLTRVARRGKR